MSETSKKLTVSFGAFSCTLAGFDDPFPIMKQVVDYFQQLAASDPAFGAHPERPSTDALKAIAEARAGIPVEAEMNGDEVVLRQAEPMRDQELAEPEVDWTQDSDEVGAGPEAEWAPDLFADDVVGDDVVGDEEPADLAFSATMAEAEAPAVSLFDAPPVASEEAHAVADTDCDDTVDTDEDVSAQAGPDTTAVEDAPVDPQPTATQIAAMRWMAPAPDVALSDAVQAAQVEAAAIAFGLIDCARDLTEAEVARQQSEVEAQRAAELIPEAPEVADARDEPVAEMAQPEEAAAPEPEAQRADAEADEEDTDDLAAAILSRLDASSAAEPVDVPAAEDLSAPEPAESNQDEAPADASAEISPAAMERPGIPEWAAELIADEPVVDTPETDDHAATPKPASEKEDVLANLPDQLENFTKAPSGQEDEEGRDESALDRILGALRSRAASLAADISNVAKPEDAAATDVAESDAAEVGDDAQPVAAEAQAADVAPETVSPEPGAEPVAAETAADADAPPVRLGFGSAGGPDAAPQPAPEPVRDLLNEAEKLEHIFGERDSDTDAFGWDAATRAPEADRRPAATPLVLTPQHMVPSAETAGAPALVAAEDTAPQSTDAADLRAYAKQVGAASLPDLLEASAAFVTLVAGRQSFSRSELLGMLGELNDQPASQEARIKSFGKLLRGGRIQRAENGAFEMSDFARQQYEQRASA